MGFVHGKGTVVIFNGVNISAFTNNTEDADDTDTHDVTCYGAARKAYIAGLGDGKFTLQGTHDDGATGPRKVIKAAKRAGSIVPFIYRPSGTGAGLQQSSVSVIVQAYTDTSPVAGVVAWKAVLQMTGDINENDQ